MVTALVRIFGSSERVVREPIRRETLEAAITTAVKRSDPCCEPFIGVTVECISPNSSFEANWAVKGVRFGKSDRKQCNSIMNVIVERLRQEFEIAG